MFTLNDIVQGNAGRVSVSIYGTTPPADELTFRSAHHDSRQIQPGDLFVALKGTNVDGHSFIPAIARSGALGVLCTEPASGVPPTFLQIVVPDVVAALHATARFRTQRQQ